MEMCIVDREDEVEVLRAYKEEVDNIFRCEVDKVDGNEFAFNFEELDKELRRIEEDYEHRQRIWNPWGVYEPMLDPIEFARVYYDYEFEDEVAMKPWECYDSENEAMGYTYIPLEYLSDIDEPCV